MPEIKLPDGKIIPFSKSINGFEIANKISKSLSKEACVMNVDGVLKDLSFTIDNDVEVDVSVSVFIWKRVFSLWNLTPN